MSHPRVHRGDDGSTDLLGKVSMSKAHIRIETLGVLDEASAALGLARASSRSPQTIAMVKDIQRDLYVLMTELAATPENVGRYRKMDRSRIEWLEFQIGMLENQVPAPGGFILPGDSFAGAAFALARTIIRRAERRVAELALQGEETSQNVLPYLNRLSLVCFWLELTENRSAGADTSLARD